MGGIWSGVYARLDEAPLKGDGFSSSRWRESCESRFQVLVGELDCANGSPIRLVCSETPLPMLASTVQAEVGSVRILDFGGGLGESYLLTRKGLPQTAGLHFDILEVPEVGEAGARLHRGGGPIFLASLEDASGPYDIVHWGSSIHYIDDWQGVLGNCAEITGRYMLFVDLPAGEIPTFASAQTYYESQIPVWFFNDREFIELMEDLGFTLIWRSTYAGFIKGKKQPLPMENFPADHRLDYSCNLLFKRISA